MAWTTNGSPDHVNVHGDPSDPTASGCCFGAATSTSSSTFSPTGSPTTLTAPTVASPTTVRYVVHVRNSSTGLEGYSSVVAVTVSPRPQQCPGTLCIGDVVAVTGGAGVNLRPCAEESSRCTPIVLMPYGTRMAVIGGPSQASGYTWWNVSGYVNGILRTGWAFENGLSR